MEYIYIWKRTECASFDAKNGWKLVQTLIYIHTCTYCSPKYRMHTILTLCAKRSGVAPENRNTSKQQSARNIKPCPFTVDSQSHLTCFWCWFPLCFAVVCLFALYNVSVVSFFASLGCVRFQWTFLYSLNTHKQNPMDATRLVEFYMYDIKIRFVERKKEKRRRNYGESEREHKLDIIQCSMPKININHVTFRV